MSVANNARRLQTAFLILLGIHLSSCSGAATGILNEQGSTSPQLLNHAQHTFDSKTTSWSQICSTIKKFKGWCKGIMTLKTEETISLGRNRQVIADIHVVCDGTFFNQTLTERKITCSGNMHMTVHLEAIISEKDRRTLNFTYQCNNEFSAVARGEGGDGSNPRLDFYQNTLCDGIETSKMNYSAPERLLDDALRLGSFLRVNMGYCHDLAKLLSVVDTLGVLFTYIVIPGCIPGEDIREEIPKNLYEQEFYPINFSCDGTRQEITQPCSGLLMGVAKLPSGTVSCRCRGEWNIADDNTTTCDGEFYGEQVRQDQYGSYLRSSVCAGVNTFLPASLYDPIRGSYIETINQCKGANVKSTMFQPNPESNQYVRSLPRDHSVLVVKSSRLLF